MADPGPPQHLPPVDLISRLRGERRVRVRLRSYAHASGWVAAIAIAVMVGQVVDTASGPGHGPVAIAVAIELLVIALAMTFLVRICLGGVLVGADDVIVRNPLRSHRLPWTDIAQFEISDDPPYPQLARAALRNGSSLEIAGIRSGREGDGGDLVSGLNELLAERS